MSDAPLATDRGMNLRLWFYPFLLWMGGLTAVVVLARGHAEAGSHVAFVVMWLALYAFYLSLCNTFVPAPTPWIIMLLAGNDLGLFESPLYRLAVVSVWGAFATSIANLNEYHVFTFLLRYGRVARVRETRLYRWAANGFAVSPFAIVSLGAFVPIPVDVVRWLAIVYRYSRWRFFWAYMLGRSIRYAIWCLVAIGLSLGFWQIMAFQAALVGLALVKVLVGAIRSRRRKNDPAEPVEPAATSA